MDADRRGPNETSVPFVDERGGEYYSDFIGSAETDIVVYNKSCEHARDVR